MSLLHLKENDEELAKQLARHLLDLAKLSQKEMSQNELHEFIHRSHELLQTVASKNK
jgi:HSP90 family molecular chaperone